VRLPRFVGAALVSLLVVNGVVGRYPLLEPVPVAVKIAGTGLFFLLGLWLARQCEVPPSLDPFKRVAVVVAIAVLCGMIGNVVAQSAVTAAAFAGEAPATLVNARVVHKRIARYGEHLTNERIAFVLIDRDTQPIKVRVAQDLDGHLEPALHPGRDCLAIGIQRGRWGFRRALVPAALIEPPLGLDRYRRCG
jgi:hypothetical protein